MSRVVNLARNNTEQGLTKQHNFLAQGSILAVTGIIVRLIGLLYRMPMIGIIGNKGNGYYTSGYSIYSLFLILSSYSFPLAISKLVSTRVANNRFKDAKNVLSCALTVATFIGGISFLVMWFGSGPIANLMQKPFLKYVLRPLAPALFIMAYLGVLRGFFQGFGTMVPTSISQILEQVANAVCSILFAYLFFKRGEIANLVYDTTEYSYSLGAMGGTFGTCIGAAVALAFFIFIFLNNAKIIEKASENNGRFVPETNSQIYNLLFLTITPIIISSTVYNISSVVDDLVFSNIMAYKGLTDEIVTDWGIFGEYHLLFNIPVAIASALSSATVPSISNALAKKDRIEVAAKIKYGINFAMIIVIPSFVGLCVLAKPVCRLLFFNLDTTRLVPLVIYGSISVVFFSLATITNGILQGLDKLDIPIKHCLIALGVHVVLLALLLLFTDLRIHAIVISNIVFALIVCILNNIAIQKIIRYKQNIAQTYVKPFFAAFMMGASVCIAYWFFKFRIFGDALFENRLYIAIMVISCMALAGLIYFIFLIIFGAVRKRDTYYMTFFKKFSIFLR